ncbi:MAG TPA: GcrA family cell cycle regulator, partial [Phenylobacterium sp.]
AASPEPPGRVADLLDLAPGVCRWPIGDPKAADFSFCGEARTTGAYCAGHAARAVTGRGAGRRKDDARRRFLARTG